MMTWMTTKSLFDTAESLATPQLAVAHMESDALFYELVYGEPSEDLALGPAPAPLKLMWRGYEVALAAYSVALGAVLAQRGITRSHRVLLTANTAAGLDASYVAPPWFEDTDVLRSHRSNLMRRWPESYSWRKIPADMPYIWPVMDDSGGYKLKLSKYDLALLESGERQLPNKIKERISNA